MIMSMIYYFRGGWKKVKLYFMLGLPTETPEDRLAIADLANKIVQIAIDDNALATAPFPMTSANLLTSTSLP